MYNTIKYRERASRRRDRKRIFLKEYKQDKSCSLCGWREHPEILQFHHIEPALKKQDISKLTQNDKTPTLLEREIKKCTLLCPNCHFWHHYNISKKF